MKHCFLWLIAAFLPFLFLGCEKPDLYNTSTAENTPMIAALDNGFRIMINKHSELRCRARDARVFIKGGAFVKVDSAERAHTPVQIVLGDVELETTDAELNIDSYDLSSGKGKLTILKGLVKFKNKLIDTSLTSGGFWFGSNRLDSTIDWQPELEIKWLDNLYRFGSLNVHDLAYGLNLFYRVETDYKEIEEDPSAIFLDVNFDIREPVTVFLERLQKNTEFKIDYTRYYSTVTITKQ